MSPIRPAPPRRPVGQLRATADGLHVRVVPAGTRWYRVSQTAFGLEGACHFAGRDPGVRFNDPGPGATHAKAPAAGPGALPDAGDYGTCYFGTTVKAAFVEVFYRDLPRKGVRWTALAKRHVVEVELLHPVVLLHLADAGLLRAHVAGDITTGDDYRPAQVVARTYWRHPARFAGIEYRARHDTSRWSIALFDRARAAVAPASQPAAAIREVVPLDPARSGLAREVMARYERPVRIVDDRASGAP